MKRPSVIALVLSCSIGLGAESATDHPTGSRTTPPTIELLSPLGIVKGTTQRLTVEGYNLHGASEIHFSEPTIRGRILQVQRMPDVAEPVQLGAAGLPTTVDLGPQPKRYQVDIEVNIENKANVGPVGFRLVTEFGTSPTGKILVEPKYQITSENSLDHGAGDTTSKLKEVSLPVILTGVISEPGDEDFFAVTAEAGEQVVFEESGVSIGSSINPVIDILTENYTPLYRGQKSRNKSGRPFSYRFQEKGTYLVRVSDYTKTGGKNHFYRIRVGDYPLIRSTFPLGVQRGKTAEITLKGFNLNPEKIEVLGTPSWKDEFENVTVRREGQKDASYAESFSTPSLLIRPETSKGRTFNSVKLALGNHPEVKANGNNSTVTSAQKIDFPTTINGRMNSDAHYFRFTAEKDQLILVDVTAAQVGSKLDSVIDILDADGKPVALATLRAVAVTYTDLDDHTSKQAEIRFQLTEDITAGDYLMLGSEVTRVTRMPRQPDEGMAVESFPPIIPGRRTRGTTRLTSFGTSAQAHALGTPMYKVQVHPPGKEFPPNGLPVVQIYHHNDDGGVPNGKDSFLKFKVPTDGEYLVRLRDTHGRSGEDYTYRLALRPPRADFSLSSEPRTPNIPRGERVPLRITAFRHDGFDGDIRVTVKGLPTEIQADDTVIPSGQMVATVMLHANASAPIGKAFPLSILGTAVIDGKSVSRSANPADSLQFVAVTKPADILLMTDKREVVLKPGQDANITVSVLRKNGFDGRVPVEVLNLPPNTDTPEVGLNRIVITEEIDSRTFSIRALPDAKPIEQMIYVAGIVETRSPQPNTFIAEPIALKIVATSDNASNGK
ncbi:MAG: hypothetical protein CMN58_06555 [Solibacterales bacterium]|nr:hypothetical protein [Bryobacterales bacterium]|tara:strand:- start:233089 stop:235590 length:2502 start_codon:yes stop_codon:yes gene_type:complete